MNNPKCKICGSNHSIREPHVFETAAAHAKRPTETKSSTPAQPNKQEVSSVTQSVTNVTPVTPPVTTVNQNVSRVSQQETSVTRPHCPTCTCTRNQTHAERQAAYRARRK